MSIIYVTGGARSGKSEFAETIIRSKGENILYIATCVPFDDEMKNRIAKHRSRRPSSWVTCEGYRDTAAFLTPGYQAAMLDCLTILITNLMMDITIDWDTAKQEEFNAVEADILKQVEAFLTQAEKVAYPCVVVSNELGMGLVPANRFSRIFRDIAGKANQMAAARAQEAYFVVSGIPISLKQGDCK